MKRKQYHRWLAHVLVWVIYLLGSLSAQCSFNPAGERGEPGATASTRSMATANPHVRPSLVGGGIRSSTKYQDDEPDLPFYGYRFYNASSGRWLSRDPIMERGGENLYAFVRNTPPTRTDGNGHISRDTFCPLCECVTMSLKGKPVDPPGIGWYSFASPVGTLGGYGNLMTITWTVIGNPRKCKYAQFESGFSQAYAITGNGKRKHSDYGDHPDLGRELRITYGVSTATYEDESGALFTAPFDNGKWKVELNLHIDFACFSSDGRRVDGGSVDFRDESEVFFFGTGNE